MTDLSIDRPASSEPAPLAERAWRHRYEIVGLALVAVIWVAIVVFSEPFGRLWGTGQDAYCYWFPSLDDPYARSDWTDPIAYVYSPAFLQLLQPIRVLPWQAYMAIWTAILLGAVFVLTGRKWFAVGAVLGLMELAGGNIHLLLAAAMVLVVTGLSQLAGLLTIGTLLLLTGEPVGGEGAAWGMAAGLVGAGTLAVFYTALSSGAMSLVAPLSACGAVVPVAVAVAGSGAPGGLALGGMALALAGIVLIARRDEGARGLTPRVVGLAAAAALGIGTVLALLQQGANAEGASGLGVVFAARVAAVTLTGLALLATRTVPRAERGSLLPVVAVGAGDTGANALFAVASEGGSDALVAMLGSLYPVTTVLLARALLAERLTRRQSVGVVFALAGAALVSTG